MSKAENIELKDAYIDAVKTSGLGRDTLKYLHKVNDNTLDKWLYVPDRYPSFRACWELWMLIRKRRLLMSRLLHTAIYRSISRANDTHKKMEGKEPRNSLTLPERLIIGEPQYRGRAIQKNGVNRYIVNGVLMSLREANVELGYKPDTQQSALRRKIRVYNILPGEDISHLTKDYDSIDKRMRFYSLHGEIVSISDASWILGYDQKNNCSQLRAKLKRMGLRSGMDISHIPPRWLIPVMRWIAKG